MKKIKILVVNTDTTGGVGFYRSVQPHKQLEKQFSDDFEVTFETNPDYSNIDEFKKYDIVHIHKGVKMNMNLIHNCIDALNESGIITIMDIDDNWDVGKHHPQYVSQKTYELDKKIISNFKHFQYVTTTTPIFADKIKKYNENVVVIPNAIDPSDEHFTTHKEPNTRNLLRVGLIMGSAHEYDVKILSGMVNMLPKEIKDKIQIVLCGFDNRGSLKVINPITKEVTERPLKPEESVWHRYEGILTDNWKICSPEYKTFLDLHVPDSEYPFIDNEHYRRCWTKDMNHYYEHYNTIDVLLAPLEENDFNKVKSQLKCIECCFSNTAIIASNYGPYTIDLVNVFEKGGTINKNGNAILIESKRNHKDWAKSIEKLVKNPELVTMLQENLHNDLYDKYNLQKVTADRAEFYKEIIKERRQR